jgi:hypothetical protein
MDKKRKFCTTNLIGFTHRWLHALAILLGATPYQLSGFKPFPNFALFTTLLGRVRLSQSAGCKTNTSVLDNRSEHRKDRVSIFGASTPSIDAGYPCIPTLNGVPLQRGTYSPPIPPLVKIDKDRYELAKMAVTERARGRGIGWLLGQTAVTQARQLGAKTLCLQSNTVLEPAIKLYQKLGFQKVVGQPSPYQRCNIQMELKLV